jgi:hypothetical protein
VAAGFIALRHDGLGTGLDGAQRVFSAAHLFPVSHAGFAQQRAVGI